MKISKKAVEFIKKNKGAFLKKGLLATGAAVGSIALAVVMTRTVSEPEIDEVHIDLEENDIYEFEEEMEESEESEE